MIIPEYKDSLTDVDKINNVRKFLDVGTVHITLSDDTKLRENEDEYIEPMIVRNYEYGYWIWVPDTHEEFVELIKGQIGSGFSSAFQNIFIKARKLGCDYIILDRDGPEHQDLDTFDW